MNAFRDLDELAIGLPPLIVQAIKTYVEHRRPTGGFLRAVLGNDLMTATGLADPQCAVLLQPICRFIYNRVPRNARGSYDAVDAWIAERKT